MPRATSSETRRRLVEAAIDFLREHGAADRSLRDLAAGIGTSHRMLLYHFGSKDGLLVEVARAVEQRQREEVAALFKGFDPANSEDLNRKVWRRLRSPDLASLERLFFELYGRGLGGGPEASRLLEGVVDSWVATTLPALREAGIPASDAPVYARLAIAVTRGLLLDVLATGDEDAVDEAYELYLTTMVQSVPGQAAKPAGRGRPGSV